MIIPKDLQELQKERLKMEDDVGSLKEQQKKLEERAKELELKIMEELNSKNDETRDNISHLESIISGLEQKLGQIKQDYETRANISNLESMIGDLEQKLGHITQKPEQDETKNETEIQASNCERPTVTAEINPEVLESSSKESAVVVSAEDFSEAFEEAQSELEQRYGKKKHKFF